MAIDINAVCVYACESGKAYLIAKASPIKLAGSSVRVEIIT